MSDTIYCLLPIRCMYVHIIALEKTHKSFFYAFEEHIKIAYIILYTQTDS